MALGAVVLSVLVECIWSFKTVLRALSLSVLVALFETLKQLGFMLRLLMYTDWLVAKVVYLVTSEISKSTWDPRASSKQMVLSSAYSLL